MLNISVIDNNVNAESNTTVYATEHLFFTSTDLTGWRFNVTVGIANVTDWGAWSIMLDFNASLLEAEYVYATPDTADNTDWVPVDLENYTFHPDGPPTINNTLGRVFVGALVPVGQGNGRNGDFELVKIQFRIILAPPSYLITYSCILDLHDDWTIIGDSYGNPITVNVEDGIYVYKRPTDPNWPPLANFTWSPLHPYVGDNVTLTDTSTPNGGTITAWVWTISGPATLTGPNNESVTTFHCDRVGTVNVTLTVWDTLGMNATTSELITISMYGDVNGDGEINILDLKSAKLAYSGWILKPNPVWHRTAALALPNDEVNILDLKIEKLIYSGIL